MKQQICRLNKFKQGFNLISMLMELEEYSVLETNLQNIPICSIDTMKLDSNINTCMLSEMEISARDMTHIPPTLLIEVEREN